MRLTGFMMKPWSCYKEVLSGETDLDEALVQTIKSKIEILDKEIEDKGQ